MPDKNQPTMLYDGDCGFCSYWIERWKKLTGDKINYASFQVSGKDFPQVSEENCREAVQLIMSDGSVTSGAHAVFKAMDVAGKLRVLHWMYEYLPLFGRIMEIGYQWIANHRFYLSRYIFKTPRTCRADTGENKK